MMNIQYPKVQINSGSEDQLGTNMARETRNDPSDTACVRYPKSLVTRSPLPSTTRVCIIIPLLRSQTPEGTKEGELVSDVLRLSPLVHSTGPNSILAALAPYNRSHHLTSETILNQTSP